MQGMTRAELADCARVLALQVADYRIQFGDIADRDGLALLAQVQLTAEQARLLADGMEVLTCHAVAVGGMPDENMPIGHASND
jgi:hypothetical protein